MGRKITLSALLHSCTLAAHQHGCRKAEAEHDAGGRRRSKRGRAEGSEAREEKKGVGDGVMPSEIEAG